MVYLRKFVGYKSYVQRRVKRGNETDPLSYPANRLEFVMNLYETKVRNEKTGRLRRLITKRDVIRLLNFTPAQLKTIFCSVAAPEEAFALEQRL